MRRTFFWPFVSFAVVLLFAGCSSSSDDRQLGEGGLSSGGSHGRGGSDGGSSAVPCDCSLGTSACGSALAEAALDHDCTLPLMPGPDDLLSCNEGTWSLETTCADGCLVGEGEEDACAVVVPTVEMDWVVVQAQVEPFRGNQSSLDGDPAVERVQQALADEGFSVTVDGWFGQETAERYSDWQKQLGFTGLNANGIPGPSSLASLGENRFELVQTISVGPRVTFTGRTVNERTKDMLIEAEKLLGFPIVLSQGSYNPGGVGASAGTHDGGGTVDVSVSSLSTQQRWRTVEAMRTVGFAAWLRNPNQGSWPYHIHAVSVGDTDLSISARNQVADFYVGKNGLASHAPDDTPASYQVPFTWWEQYQAR